MVYGKDPTSFFVCGYLIVPARLIEETVLFPLNGSAPLLENQLIILVRSCLFLDSLFYPIGLYVYPYASTTVLKEAMALIILNLNMIDFCLYADVSLYFIYVLGNCLGLGVDMSCI